MLHQTEESLIWLCSTKLRNILEMPMLHQIEKSLEMTVSHQIEKSLEITVSHQIEESLKWLCPTKLRIV